MSVSIIQQLMIDYGHLDNVVDIDGNECNQLVLSVIEIKNSILIHQDFVFALEDAYKETFILFLKMLLGYPL